MARGIVIPPIPKERPAAKPSGSGLGQTDARLRDPIARTAVDRARRSLSTAAHLPEPISSASGSTQTWYVAIDLEKRLRASRGRIKLSHSLFSLSDRACR